MSEDRTGETRDSRSFEERVFAKFDQLDERFGRELSDVTIRIGKLEERQFDTKPIWERALAAIVEIHDELKAINSRLNGIDQRFDAIDKRFDAIDQRFDVIDQRFEGIDHRFGVMDKSFAAIDARFDKQDIDAEDNFRGLERKLDVLNKDILELRADQRYVDSRLEKIESQAKPS
jgi:hypothetical protein